MTRKVLIQGIDQKTYFGELDEAEWPPIDEVPLKNVMQLLTLDSHIRDPTGGSAGVSRGYMMMTIASAPGPLPVLHVRAAGWIDPVECGILENLEKMLEGAQRSKEAQDRKPPTILPAGPGALQELSKVPSIRKAFSEK